MCKSRVGLSKAKIIKFMHIIYQLCLTGASICMLILTPTSKTQCGTLWLHTWVWLKNGLRFRDHKNYTFDVFVQFASMYVQWCCPPVLKTCQWKIHHWVRWFSDQNLKPPFTMDFPLPRLLTGGPSILVPVCALNPHHPVIKGSSEAKGRRIPQQGVPPGGQVGHSGHTSKNDLKIFKDM